MRKVDLAEKRKADAKNSVEEYVYEMRDKISDSLSAFITEQVGVSWIPLDLIIIFLFLCCAMSFPVSCCRMPMRSALS